MSAVPPKLLHKIAKHFHGNPHKGPFTIKEIEAALIRPQKGMDRTLRFFEEYSCDPIPKNVIEKYQKAQKLYEKIVEAENEQQKWFNLLIKCEDKEYICDNIENRIGRNLNNIELWNLYFDLLKQDKCKKRLLHLYSRYCRYFLDDFKMKEEYKEAAKKNGAIKVFWKNAFDFEIYETNINLIISDSGHLILNDSSEKTIDSKNESVSKNIKKASFGTYKIQTFSFPKTFMAYILENISPNILRKLQKSCKYFFILQPYPICHKFLRVSESDNIKFNGHSIQISNNFYDESNEIFNNKFILSNSYLVSSELFLSKIYQCHAKYIRIGSIELGITLKEFTFLVGHGNVEVLRLSDAPIINDDKTPVTLEEILKMLPKIIEFKHVCSSPLTASQPFCTTPRTFEILPTLKFSNKIQFFHIYYVTYFESIGFCEFLKKNIISTSEVSVGFGPRMDLNEAEKFGKEVETELTDFDWPGNEKPFIRVFKPTL